jgi:hypothetical protein
MWIPRATQTRMRTHRCIPADNSRHPRLPVRPVRPTLRRPYTGCRRYPADLPIRRCRIWSRECPGTSRPSTTDNRPSGHLARPPGGWARRSGTPMARTLPRRLIPRRRTQNRSRRPCTELHHPRIRTWRQGPDRRRSEKAGLPTPPTGARRGLLHTRLYRSNPTHRRQTTRRGPEGQRSHLPPDWFPSQR